MIINLSSEANDDPVAAGPSDGELSDSRVPVRLRPALRYYADALHEAFPERVYAMSLYISRFARAGETRRFIRAIVQLCSERFNLNLPTPADP